MNNLNDIRNSMNKIMDEYGPCVYRLALARTGNPDMSSDIYQQTFLLLLEKKPEFSHKMQLRVWLLRTAHKLVANELKRTDNNHVPLEKAPEIVTDTVTAAYELYDMLSSLDEIYREPVVLFYIEDMSISDIAKSLELSVSTVKTRLHRARKQLEKLYKEELS